MRSSPQAHSRPSFLTVPPLTETDAAEGAGIISEIPGPAGILLWGAYRDLMSWLKVPARRRTGLFPERSARVWKAEIARETDLPEELRSALSSISAVTESPEIGPEVIAGACHAISSWAEGAGAPATRLAFTQAAALANPVNARLALVTGKLAREQADYARAESWLRKAIRVARSTRDWETYIWSYVGLGVLYMRVGNYPASDAVSHRVIRAARHHRMKGMEGLAFHQLFILEARDNHQRKAYEYARAALEAYGRTHERLTALAHDVARFWSEQHHFTRALPVFEAALPLIRDPGEQAVVAANIAWAAAGSGNRSRYEQARRQAVGLLSRAHDQVRTSEVLSTLAVADAYVGDWQQAEETAEFALEITLRRREQHLQSLAEDALRLARSRSLEGGETGEELPTVTHQADRLAGDLVALLLGCG